MEGNRTKKYVSHARNRRIIRREDHLRVMTMRLLLLLVAFKLLGG
jgi:hypothetical protein